EELGLRGSVSQLMVHAEGHEILCEALRPRMGAGGWPGGWGMRLGSPYGGPERQAKDAELGEHRPETGPWPLTQIRGDEWTVLGWATRMHQQLLCWVRKPPLPRRFIQRSSFGSPPLSPIA